MRPQSEAESSRQLGLLFMWLAPALLVAQYLGPGPIKPVVASALYFLFFSGSLWLGWAKGEAPIGASDSADRKRWFGICLGGIGATGWLLGMINLVDVGSFLFHFDLQGWLGTDPGRSFLPIVAAWPTAIGLAYATNQKLAPEDFVRLGVLLAAPLLALLVTGVEYQELAILSPKKLSTQVLALLAGAGLLTVFVTPTTSVPVLLSVLIVSGLALRACGLWTWEITPITRDMLPLIQSAQDSFLAGENPYRIYQMQRGSEVPLTYLPAMWLLYLCPRALALDIRWMGILADLAVVASLFWLARTRQTGEATGQTWPEAAALGLAAVWLFLPSIHWNGIYAEPHIWWGVLALYLACVLRRNWWLACVLLGLVVSTRHFGAVLVPFTLIAIVRDLGVQKAIPRLGVAGAVASVLLVPFAAADPEAFWFGTFQWLREYGPAHQNWFYHKFGFAGPMYRAGLEGWFLPIQSLSVAVLLGLYALWPRKRFSPPLFVRMTGTAYLLFIMFNGLVWDSFYIGSFVFIAVGLVCPYERSHSNSSGDSEPDSSSTAWMVGAGALVVSIACGIWLLNSLVTFHSKQGLDRVQSHLESTLQSEDLLIDRTSRNLEFIQGDPVLRPEQRPAGTTVANDLFSHGLLLDDSPTTTWVAARTSWNRQYLERIAAIGDVQFRRVFGEYTLIKTKIPPVKLRLSRQLNTFSPAWTNESQGSSHRYTKNARSNTPVWTTSSLPSWVQIEPRQCQIGPLNEKLLYAHPYDKAAINLAWQHVQLGDSLLVYGGIQNSVVRWDYAPVRVQLLIDGERQARFRLRNRPGPRWTGIDTTQWAEKQHRVSLVLETKDDRQRWTCLDAVVLGSSD